jgi:hypothetical protein
VRFVVADVGAKPEWVLPSRCFEFWKGEVAPHLLDEGQGAKVDDFPGGYCYFAAEWEAEGPLIVVLQRCH